MYQNSRKARLGGLAGLQDPAVMDRKRAEEKDFLAAAAKKPPLGAECEQAIETIDKSLAVWAAIRDDYDLLERGQAFYSELFTIARTLVRLAEETAKPNADRLREYRESNLDSLKQELFSPGPDLRRPANRALGRLAEHVPGAEGIRRPVGPEGDGGQVARAAGGRVGPRHQAGRRRGAPATGRRRHQGHRGLRRSDDPAGAAGRQAGPQGPRAFRAAGRGAAALGLRQAGQRPVCDLRHRDVSRRDVHAAVGVRAGEGVS